jgi:Phage terminase large subunit (GpA)
VKWDKGPNGEHLPETAYYLCEHCGAIWDDAERNVAIAEADRRSRAGDRTCGWIAEHPGRSTAGFHIPAFLSPWLTLAEIVTEFLKARHDPSLLQVWVNTVLGEPWEEPAERLEGAGLIARLENYGPQSLPHQVRVLTVGVDVQGDRLEIVAVGWGERDESWIVDPTGALRSFSAIRPSLPPGPSSTRCCGCRSEMSMVTNCGSAAAASIRAVTIKRRWLTLLRRAGDGASTRPRVKPGHARSGREGRVERAITRRCT